MTKTNLERIREEFEKAVTINIDKKPILMYGKRATNEISDFWIKRFETLLQQRMDEIEGEAEKIINDLPEVNTNFEDGGDYDYRERRITIDSQKRSSYISGIRQVLNIIKLVDKNK